MDWFTIISILIGGGLLGGFLLLLWAGKREHRKTEAELSKFFALPESSIREKALRLLAQPGLFECKPATAPLPELSLPQSVQEVLARFEEITCGEFWIGRAALNEKSPLPGYTKIGADFEFEEILVRKDSTQIYSSYGPVHGKQPPETVPSLWHKLILASNTPLHEALSSREHR